MLIAVDRLLALVTDIFAAAGCSPEEARRVAEGLVDANLTGHDSHGVARVSRYVDWLQAGEVEAGRSIAVLSEAGALAVVDGEYGFGATVGRQAVELGIRKAAELGTAIVALRHAGHLGRIGQWAELALASGLVSIHFVNVGGSVLVAPYGGVDRRFSTRRSLSAFPSRASLPSCSTSRPRPSRRQGPGGRQWREAGAAGSLIDPDGTLSADPATLYGPLDGTPDRDHRKGKGAIRPWASTRARASPSCASSWGACLSARAPPVPTSSVSRTEWCRSTWPRRRSARRRTWRAKPGSSLTTSVAHARRRLGRPC
ncbi:Ldh family oxidoreductase [Micromonospora sp. STR1s_5]|nr:Ldh family oxidoreductase [Micromonospora sp. STR1s_5]